MIRIKIGIWQSEVYQSIDKAIGKIRFTTTDRNHGSRHDFMFFVLSRHGDELIVNSATTCDGNPTTKFIFEAVELIELGETDSNKKIGEINISSNNKTLRQLVNEAIDSRIVIEGNYSGKVSLKTDLSTDAVIQVMKYCGMFNEPLNISGLSIPLTVVDLCIEVMSEREVGLQHLLRQKFTNAMTSAAKSDLIQTIDAKEKLKSLSTELNRNHNTGEMVIAPPIKCEVIFKDEGAFSRALKNPEFTKKLDELQLLADKQ